MAELQPPEGQINGGPLVVVSTENVGTKRQRRPSVRLGDIGDQPYDSHPNRRTKQWKLPMKDSGKGSKTRPLMNLSGAGDYHETLDGEDREGNLDSVAIGSWKVKDLKSKRGSTTKRVRSNWVSKVDEGGGGGEGDEKFSGGEDVDDGFRDFDPEGSESPLKEQSPIHSLDNMAADTDRGHGNEREVHFHGHRRGVRTRVSEGRGHHDGVDLDGPSDTDARNWNNSEQDGVSVWLNELGLGRYAPVFEIHEVDDEVLPMLTLEDLKDMGINAGETHWEKKRGYLQGEKLTVSRSSLFDMDFGPFLKDRNKALH
ncbi:hypothetical protein F0562_024443 [Nyssa sinensis]|uniref:SAM domain-containing protein n=1 Tax=Nyssa sinensis TaxID=561372 RepID=A0A5J5BD98_9ASTE|nr:hypothetical protein F0562_024443 [Nyssa sinensis]